MPTGYTELLTQGCDAALFVGMHARSGTPDGVMNHTVSDSQWLNLRFNGILAGETGINAALLRLTLLSFTRRRRPIERFELPATCSLAMSP